MNANLMTKKIEMSKNEAKGRWQDGHPRVRNADAVSGCLPHL